MTISILIAIALTILQALDIYSTYQFLKRPDRQEGNKWLKIMMDKIGILPTLIIMKLAVFLPITYVFIRVQHEYMTASGVVIIAIYVWVIRNNWRLM